MTQRGRAGSRPGQRHPGRGRAEQPEQRQPAAPRIDLAKAKARVTELIEPVVAAAGYDLEEVALSRAGRRHVLRVLVDTDGGISLDDVALISRQISQALDAAEEAGDEVVAGEYQLEVGSPGVDRPLTLPRHWRRNVGRLVLVNGVTGRVKAADETGITLEDRSIAYPDLGPGKVQIEFKRMDEAEFDDAGADEEGDDEDEEDEEDEEDDEDEEGEK